MYTGYRDGQRTKETICRGQMVLKGNAARGLLTHHHCASATVPRPCKGRIYDWAYGPLLFIRIVTGAVYQYLFQGGYTLGLTPIAFWAPGR